MQNGLYVSVFYHQLKTTQQSGAKKEIIKKRELNVKVVAINGSPHKNGNTHQAIEIALNVLESSGIQTEIIHVGNKPLSGCIACNQCVKNKNNQCDLKDDVINPALTSMIDADGLILASPVHFSGIAGTMKCFLDRVFRVASTNGSLFRHKVGISIVTDRRAGGVSTLDQLNHYLNYAEIFVPSGNYWSVVFGTAPGEIHEDIEGIQTIKMLAQNMGWLMKAIKSTNDPLPILETKTPFSYIRK
jgi:multimeric flavodoxin WrbA